jgi:DNA-binding NarL/FixJ family response regulator
MEAIRCVKKNQPDLLILDPDLSMPKLNGISVVKDVRLQFPDLKILALTVHESDQYVLDAFDAGVNGYCIKDASRDELMVAIDSVMQGKTFISPEIADDVMDEFHEGNKKLKEKSDWDTVTQRERKVLKLLAEGYRNKEIAGFLNISIKTIEKHRANVMEKLDLHNTAALTSFAVEKGLVTTKK